MITCEKLTAHRLSNNDYIFSLIDCLILHSTKGQDNNPLHYKVTFTVCADMFTLTITKNNLS